MDNLLWTTLLHLGLCAVALGQTNIPLSTKKGPIVGITFAPNPATQVSYDAFIGIPYGSIPARFQRAVPPNSWTQPKTTQTDGKACPQPGMDFSEDCLFLNVYTPPGARNTPGTKAVMAYIHGSAFTFSSSSSLLYGPDFLVPSNVIVVTMNYRLSSTGFLTLGSKVAPGNLGLWDTALALQWIQDEISVFGGDPTRVTLFGQSAGSVMTQFHYLSPATSGLFSKAIAQSGSALNKWGHVTPTEGARRAKMLAKILGCNIDQDDAGILKCLQAADINAIVGNQLLNLSDPIVAAGNGLPFVPVLDTNLTADVPFFGQSLDILMTQALTRAKPLMTGFTTDEGILKFSDNSYKIAQDNLAAFTPQSDVTTMEDTNKEALVSQIKARYFPESVVANKVEDLVNIFTDFMFAYPSVKMTRYFANFTYGYVFAYDGSWTKMPPFFTQFKMNGVNHGDDVDYLFYSTIVTQDLSSCPSNKPDLDMKTQMVKWWTSFAMTGSPDPSWKTVSNGSYLRINSITSSINTTALESRYYDFWYAIEQSNSSATTVKITLVTMALALWGISYNCFSMI